MRAEGRPWPVLPWWVLRSMLSPSLLCDLLQGDIMIPSLQARKLRPSGTNGSGQRLNESSCVVRFLPSLPSASRVAPGTDQALGDYLQHEVTREYALVKSRQAGIFCPQPTLLPQQWQERAGVGSQHSTWLGGAA